MNDAPPARDHRLQELRQHFLSHAAAAFDLRFDPRYQGQLVTSGRGTPRGGALSERRLRLAGAGRVKDLLPGLRAGCAELAPAPAGGPDEGRRTPAAALGYVGNSRTRMSYPERLRPVA